MKFPSVLLISSKYYLCLKLFYLFVLDYQFSRNIYLYLFRLSNLLAKFEEIKAAGELLPSATSALSYNGEDFIIIISLKYWSHSLVGRTIK